MNDAYDWYQQLIKPSWLFGPVWTALYILIAISFGKVFWLVWKKQIGFAVALPFILNLIFNLAFTALQFGLKSNLLAAIDILLVLGTLIWAMAAIYPRALDRIYSNSVFDLGFIRNCFAIDNHLFKQMNLTASPLQKMDF